MIIDDSVLLPNPRQKEFGNFIRDEEKILPYDGLYDGHPFKNYRQLTKTFIALSNEKEIHERVRTKFITAVADLGGLYAVTIAIFLAFY